MQFSHYTNLCENCRRVTDLYHCRSVDAYLCEACIEELAEPENEDND
jgi:hypothetical protein